MTTVQLERHAKIAAEAKQIVAEIVARVRSSKELGWQLNNRPSEGVKTNSPDIQNNKDRVSSDYIVPKVFLDSFKEHGDLTAVSI